MSLTILHTADWHIGRSLYGRKRYDEFAAFLSWLADMLRERRVDVLLVAGDVFDTASPTNRAQELYYQFLCRAHAYCRHIIVTAGNHDSPSFLAAPRELLKALNVHVVGNASDTIDDEVIILSDEHDKAELIVCAVPYLRDRDIRLADSGESFEEKEQKLIEGIRLHYAEVAAIAEQKRTELRANVPLVAMGHLFTAGGQTVDGDGVRELYVGSLAHLSPSLFPPCFDYVALGHLHIPQTVGGSPFIRYSGSPLPIGFGEAHQEKSVCLISFDEPDPHIEQLPVPRFQRLEQVKGDWERIEQQLHHLVSEGSSAWVEVHYEGSELQSDLRQRVEEVLESSPVEVLRITTSRITNQMLSPSQPEESLEDLTEMDVFSRCLSAYQIPTEQHSDLIRSYQEILTIVHEADGNAE